MPSCFLFPRFCTAVKFTITKKELLVSISFLFHYVRGQLHCLCYPAKRISLSLLLCYMLFINSNSLIFNTLSFIVILFLQI